MLLSRSRSWVSIISWTTSRNSELCRWCDSHSWSIRLATTAIKLVRLSWCSKLRSRFRRRPSCRKRKSAYAVDLQAKGNYKNRIECWLSSTTTHQSRMSWRHMTALSTFLRSSCLKICSRTSQACSMRREAAELSHRSSWRARNWTWSWNLSEAASRTLSDRDLRKKL